MHLFIPNLRLKIPNLRLIHPCSVHKSASIYVKPASNILRVPITNIPQCPARMLSSPSPLWSPVMPRTSPRSMKTISSTPQWSRDAGWLGCQVDNPMIMMLSTCSALPAPALDCLVLFNHYDTHPLPADCQWSVVVTTHPRPSQSSVRLSTRAPEQAQAQ